MREIDRLRAHIGANVNESLGVRGGKVALPAATAPAAPGAPGSTLDPEAGWRRDRERKQDWLTMAMIRCAPQPREAFDPDELAQLTEDVRQRGILQPVRVRWEPVEEDAARPWRLVLGERRFRAALAAGHREIPALRLVGAVEPADVLEEQLAENLHRAALNPIEEARAIHCIMQLRNLTVQADLARHLHLSASRVCRALALLADLAPDVQALVASGQLTPTAALELRRLDAAEQPEAARRALEAGGTVPAVASAVAAELGRPARRAVTSTRRRLKVEGGWVTVALEDGDTSDGAVLAALEEAARPLRRSARAA